MTAAANTLLNSVQPVWRSRGIPDWLVAYLFLAPAAAVFLGLITYPVLDGIHAAFTDRAMVSRANGLASLICQAA